MKSFVILCVFVIAFCSVVEDGMCAIHIVPNATHPDYPERCFYNVTEPIILRKNADKRSSKGCVRIICTEEYELHFYACGSLQGNGRPCRVIEGDPSKPYPHCCDEYIC